MEVAKLKYEQLLRIHNTLAKDIQAHEEVKKTYSVDDYNYDRSVSCLVKHFELEYEMLWKYIREYLRIKHGITQNSPRSVFHECLKQKISTSEETTILLAMVETRNLTTHIYDTKIAQEVTLEIPHYYTLITTLLPRVAPTTLTL